MHSGFADVLVVIMGGGRGTRLYPLTKVRAKPAVSFGGKYRLIDIPIANCLRSQLNKIFVLTQFHSFSLNRHVWQSYSRELGRDGFVDVIAAEQTPTSADWFQGTADAVRQSMPYILYHRPSLVLILSGDQVYSLDYRHLVQWHKSHGADITIMAHWAAKERLKEFGIVKTDSAFRVADFCEKPNAEAQIDGFTLSGDRVPADRPYLASMGIYLFDIHALISVLSGKESDFGKTLIPAAARQFNMYACPFDGYWEDVGSIEAFYEANMLWRQGGGISELFQGGASMVTHSRQLPPTHIRGTMIEDSLIADGCEIDAKRIARSIIGVRSRIGRGTVIEDSIIMGNDRPGELASEIGNNCLIRKSIIDKNVVLEHGCILVNSAGVMDADRDPYVIRSGLIVVPGNVRLRAGTRLE
jgi:glucose-1-phosphate adenylyltransferase